MRIYPICLPATNYLHFFKFEKIHIAQQLFFPSTQLKLIAHLNLSIILIDLIAGQANLQTPTAIKFHPQFFRIQHLHTNYFSSIQISSLATQKRQTNLEINSHGVKKTIGS